MVCHIWFEYTASWIYIYCCIQHLKVEMGLLERNELLSIRIISKNRTICTEHNANDMVANHAELACVQILRMRHHTERAVTVHWYWSTAIFNKLFANCAYIRFLRFDLLGAQHLLLNMIHYYFIVIWQCFSAFVTDYLIGMLEAKM